MAFPYRNAASLLDQAGRLGLSLPWSENMAILSHQVEGDGFALPNPLCAQPMEGNDADEAGAPTELTIRRYRRVAAGGSGLIWVEAVAISHQARANPRQLLLTRKTLPAYAHLMREILAAAEAAGRPRPAVVVQLTHSGRNTTGTRIAASAHPVMNPHQKLPMDYPIIRDDELLSVQRQFAQASAMLREAGFDGVDVKCCHLYLLSELLGAKNRPGPFGGNWENRSRMQLETTQGAIRAAGADWLYAVRLNASDMMAEGFGTSADMQPDYAEPVDLVRRLSAMGVKLFNATMGTPYYNPHINRPYAGHPRGEGYDAPEDPLLGVARLLGGARAIQEAAPDAVCVATGLSYLRQFAPNVAAGLLEDGWARAAGFGREWLAYPDYALDAARGAMSPSKCCVTCGLCTYLMRRGEAVGCPVRDGEYRPRLRRLLKAGR